MKITIELPDALIEQVRCAAQQEGTTLCAMVEEGLQRSLEARRQMARRQFDFPSYGGNGLTDDFQDARNAFPAYDMTPPWDSASEADLPGAHEALMAKLLDIPGRYRRTRSTDRPSKSRTSLST